MAVTLNQSGYAHARKLFSAEQFVFDKRSEWSKHKPSPQQKNDYLEAHGIKEYSHWFLGVDDTRPENTKSHYKFPYGDFKKLHRCALLAVEVRAGQYKYYDIEHAAAHLHGMIDGVREDRFVQPQDW
jgi:hypothetical protein